MNNATFQKACLEAFGFLVESYGFTVTSVSLNTVIYSSAQVRIELNYSERGEVDMIIDTHPPSHRFQFSLFLHAYHLDAWTTLGDGITSSDEDVRREVKRLSDALGRYGRRVLLCDPEVFQRMKTIKWWELPD